MIINEDSIFCSFVQTDSYTYECYKCGISLVVQDKIEEPPLIPCSAGLAKYSAGDVRNFISNNTSANIEDLCSEEEIQQRHTICKGCEFFSNNTCTECGCVLSRDKIYLNKLAIKNQSCPKNKW
jgi:hypothetical protein